MKKFKVIAIAVIMLLALGTAAYMGAANSPEEISAEAKEGVQKTKKVELAKDFLEESDHDEEVVDESVKVAENVENSEKTHQNDTAKEEVVVSDKNKTKPQSTETEKEPVKETEEKENKENVDPPKHIHSWQPVYAERQIEKTRQVAWTKCYACGADMTGNISHIDQHLLNHETNVHYGTEYRTEVYCETESYVSGYKCSCGETK